MVQNQHIHILDFINQSEDTGLFFNSRLHSSKDQSHGVHYRRSESILCSLCDRCKVSSLLNSFDDERALHKMKQVAYTGTLPLKFRFVEASLLGLMFLPIIVMFLDLIYSWTSMSAVVYLYISACGLSLYITAKIAKKEWMVRNWDEERKKRNGK